MANLGFIGGGQLARMSIQAAQRMGLNCVSLDPAADSPASQIADSFRAYGRFMGITVAVVFGGAKINPQIKAF